MTGIRVLYTMLLLAAALLLFAVPVVRSARYSEIRNVEGQSRCPCLKADQIPRPKNTSVSTESYGVGCGYHDAATEICQQAASRCDESKTTLMECEDAWCFMSWCYVGKLATTFVYLFLEFVQQGLTIQKKTQQS